jgi:hypothetical protein
LDHYSNFQGVLNRIWNKNQNNRESTKGSAKSLESDLAQKAPGLLRPLKLSSIALSSTVEITQDEAVKRHAVDKQKWRFSFFDIFKPKIAFNKLVNKLLYQFQKSHRSDFDSEFRKVFQEGIPLEKHLVKTSDNHSVELWFAKHQNPEAKTKIIPRFLINLLTNTWNNQEAICKLKGKVKHIKIMHGKNDQVIPIQDSRDLYKQAQSYSISSELIELENIGHNDIKRGMKS